MKNFLEFLGIVLYIPMTIVVAILIYWGVDNLCDYIGMRDENQDGLAILSSLLFAFMSMFCGWVLLCLGGQK